MNYTFRDVVLSEEEFLELKNCVGEFRRICRDQVYRHVCGDYLKSDDKISNVRLEISESLIYFLEEVERRNNTIK